MKRAIAALSFVTVACARHAPPPAGAPPAKAAQAVQPVPAVTVRQPAAPNEVVRRIISGGEVFARLPASCETLVVAAGKNPEQRALEIDTTEAVGCASKRKTGILLDVTDPRRIRCTGSRQQTSSLSTVTAACSIEDRPEETATPKATEAVIGGVRIFSDSAECQAATAATTAHDPSCFEASLLKAVDQRKDEVPKGEFVTRFEAFIDDASSTAWQRSADTRLCEPWKVERRPHGFSFSRTWTEKSSTSVQAIAGFGYDATCKRVTDGSMTTTRTALRGGGSGTSMRLGRNTSLVHDDKQPDALPLQGSDWFYTKRACERSPR
jgi:hypothetical protein